MKGLFLALFQFVPAGTGFVGDDGGNLEVKGRIPHAGQGNRLRENGEFPRTNDAVQRLVAVKIFVNSQTRNPGRAGDQQTYLLLNRQSAEQIVDP